MEVYSVAALAGIVSGVVQAVKPAVGGLSRFLPLLALGLGVALSYLTFGVSAVDTVTGLVIGLTASGLYSQVKTAVGK